MERFSTSMQHNGHLSHHRDAECEITAGRTNAKKQCPNLSCQIDIVKPGRAVVRPPTPCQWVQQIRRRFCGPCCLHLSNAYYIGTLHMHAPLRSKGSTPRSDKAAWLESHDLVEQSGQVTAVDGISLSVEPGVVLGSVRLDAAGLLDAGPDIIVSMAMMRWCLTGGTLLVSSNQQSHQRGGHGHESAHRRRDGDFCCDAFLSDH
jgi:hypothetical protein